MVNRFIITTIIVFASVLGADNSVAAKLGADANAAAAAVLRNYLPGTSGLGPIRVDCVDADDAARVLRVECNENCAYIPLRADNLASIKTDVCTAMGKKYDGYRVEMYVIDRDRSGKEVSRTNMDNLILFSPKRVIGPTEKAPFVSDLDADVAPLACKTAISRCGRATDGISSPSSIAGNGSVPAYSRQSKTCIPKVMSCPS